MNPIKKILAPTDFSPAAESALDEAVGLARAMGATVTLMNVYQLPPSPPD
ncbi:MAG: universal stress protein, partial [Polyangia bacterium]